MNEITIKIEGLKELTEALRLLAGESGRAQEQRPAWNPVQQPQSQMQQQVPVQQMPAQAPQQVPVQQMPAQAPQQVPVQQMCQQAPQTIQQQVPTTAVAQGYTIDQLQVAAAGLTNAGKMPQVMGILQQFGIQAMTELPKDQYGNFATALREAGAQI